MFFQTPSQFLMQTPSQFLMKTPSQFSIIINLNENFTFQKIEKRFILYNKNILNYYILTKLRYFGRY